LEWEGKDMRNVPKGEKENVGEEWTLKILSKNAKYVNKRLNLFLGRGRYAYE